MKELKWILENGFMSCILYLGVVRGLAGWGILLMTLTYAMFSITLLSTLLNFNAALHYTFPRWVNILYDIIFTAVLLWFGWYATGFAYSVTMFAVHIHSRKKQDENVPSAGAEEQTGVQRK
jgi:hypothetical protein